MTFPTQPIELYDCEVHGIGSGAELFVVEGDSAAIAVARVRDARFQAVLPMQGKPLNALKANKKAVSGYALYSILIDAIGAGWHDSIDCSKARYDRVMLLMDPDADGVHCGTLIMFFFYRWMRPLLDTGMLHVVRAPMMEITGPSIGKPLYATTPNESVRICSELGSRGITVFSKQRFRGLANLSSATLASTCLDQQTRVTQRLQVRDAEAAIALMESLRL